MTDRVRYLLGKQPARLLLIDQSAPITPDIGDNLCLALENVLALACNFTGPSRMPFFSVMVLQHYQPEVILPFSYVRNNFHRIQTALNDVHLRISESVNACKEASPSYFQAIAEACLLYRRQLQSTAQPGGFCQQLEIILLTCQSSSHVQRLVDTALASIDTQYLKRIQVVSLSCTGGWGMEDVDLDGSQSSLHSNDSSNASLSSLIEVINMEPEVLCLQNLFTGWLVDMGTDSEHLHILLPPCLNSGNAGVPLIVKCDVHERVFQPAQLPFYNQFTIHADSSSMKMVFPSTSKAMGISVPIYQLQVTSLVPVTAVCDSIVFDMPLVAKATACWKMEWDDLEKNHQLLIALCQALGKEEKAMVASLLPPSKPSHAVSQPDTIPQGRFLLVPFSDGTLLVKALATQELLLPYQPSHNVGSVTQDTHDLISESLQQLETLESYNPLDHSAGLFESLKGMGRNLSTQMQQKRPLEESCPLTNKIVVKGGRPAMKPAVVATVTRKHSELADTPLTKRIEHKTGSGAPRRTLYTQPHSMFYTEDNAAGGTRQQAHINAGQIRHGPSVVSFPSTL
ncbi:meiosis 1 arrest protein-like [Dreissena polymorpha]|uniref:Uncharacterized protein n=1 Tax=Dreissena polymorpha TaxID=45954 RepID=A0A9D4DRR1_DREPO|nr:meiosis 1 arrest protein-like [Dreissena polymorpha]KAH3752614.1 hypothetical protein DPMN_187235 [Dreissena polymorpha]